jgi:hypothetical protein
VSSDAQQNGQHLHQQLIALLLCVCDCLAAALRLAALMTTAYQTTRTGNAGQEFGDPFDFGAGHVDPVKALNPGLVFDSKFKDWRLFLCGVERRPEDRWCRYMCYFTNICYKIECNSKPGAELHDKPAVGTADSWLALSPRCLQCCATLQFACQPLQFRSSGSTASMLWLDWKHDDDYLIKPAVEANANQLTQACMSAAVLCSTMCRNDCSVCDSATAKPPQCNPDNLNMPSVSLPDLQPGLRRSFTRVVQVKLYHNKSKHICYHTVIIMIARQHLRPQSSSLVLLCLRALEQIQASLQTTDIVLHALLCSNEPSTIHSHTKSFAAMLQNVAVGRNTTYTAAVSLAPGNATSYISVKVTPPTFTLGRGRFQTLTIHVTVNRGAPFGAYMFGAITWSSNRGTTTRIPLAVKTVPFADLPDAIILRTAQQPSHTGSYSITAAFSGSIDLAAYGAVPAVILKGTATNTPGFSGYIVPAGIAYMRFALFAQDYGSPNAPDLDLFIYNPTFTAVWRSASTGSDEAVTLRNPAAGQYLAQVSSLDTVTDAGWHLHISVPMLNLCDRKCLYAWASQTYCNDGHI